MGNSYTNITTRGPDRDQVIVALGTLRYAAFVGETVSGLTVIREKESDTQDGAAWREAARSISEALACPALAVLNHDDDILAFVLFHAGRLLDEYDSCPGYWEDTDEVTAPNGGDAPQLCAVLGMPGNSAEVERVLRAGEDDEEFVFAVARHEALLKALDWPELDCQTGFGYLSEEQTDGWQLVGVASK